MENICIFCLDDQHYQCRTITMKKKKLTQQKLENWLKEEEETKKSLTVLLKEKENNLKDILKEKCRKLHKQLNCILENRKEELKIKVDSQALLNLNSNSVLQKLLYLKTEEQSFQIGVEICHNFNEKDATEEYEEKTDNNSFFLQCLKTFVGFSPDQQIEDKNTTRTINIT